MRFIAPLTLALLLALVLTELTMGKSGLPRMLALQEDLQAQQAANTEAQSSNQRLAAEVTDLKDGQEILEERARREVGMIRPGELLVVVTGSPPSTAH